MADDPQPMTASDALHEQALAAYEAGRFDDALALYETLLSARPDDAVGWYDRGNTLRRLGRIDEAAASYAQCVARKPAFAIGRHNYAVTLMLRGQLERGLKEYEWRKRCPGFEGGAPAGVPEWTGREPLAGKRLFIYPELFLGDLIQFCRYAKLAETRGAKVTLGAPPSLHRLLATLSSTIELVPKGAAPACDYACALMSLPLAFGSAQTQVPAAIPYLAADPERIARWREAIGPQGFRVGVCWQGSTEPHALPLQRSFPLAELAPIAGLAGVRLISLQKHDGLDQLERLPKGMPVETLGPDFDDGPDAFLDAAAALASLDLVITADTAVAHLAGALGARTWVALPALPDWRWGLGRAETPWYPTLRLFRQPSPGDWAGVFAEMAMVLREARNA